LSRSGLVLTSDESFDVANDVDAVLAGNVVAVAAESVFGGVFRVIKSSP
jgi:hypothetical protein